MLTYSLQNSTLFITLTGLLGCCLGSFLNVAIYRLPIMIQNTTNKNPFGQTNEASINLLKPKSFCPNCKQFIPCWAKFPCISYLFLRGISSCCRDKILKRYLIVELLTGLLFSLLAYDLGPSIKLGSSLILLISLITLFFIDLETLLLPDQITLPLLWLGLFLNIFNLFTPLKSAVLGAIIGYLFFYLIAALFYRVRKKEGMGHGDFKLLALLGAWFGWQALPAIILMASLLGSLVGILYSVKHTSIWSSQMPFGPFLVIAGITILFFHPQITLYPVSFL